MGNSVGSYDTAVELGHGGTHGQYLMLSGLPRSSSLGSLCHGYSSITEVDVVVEGSFTLILHRWPIVLLCNSLG